MKDYLRTLAMGKALTEEQTSALFDMFMGGEGGDASIGAYLMGTASRRLECDELVGAATSLRKHMVKVDCSSFCAAKLLVDTCGTGGSGLNTFNTSTLAAFVVAACGYPVAKHGNRGRTSKCGSADLLTELGVKVDLAPEKVAECIQETGFGFMFAPLHHPATKRVQIIRQELGFRTIFNFLGPLANPAGAEIQLLGVSDKGMLPLMAEALNRLGTKRAMVVCGEDGLDEITLTSATSVSEVYSGELKSYSLEPEEFELSRVSFSDIEGAEAPNKAAHDALCVLKGEKGACRDLVALNSGAALYLCSAAPSIAEGILLATEALDSGRALGVLERVKTVSQAL